MKDLLSKLSPLDIEREIYRRSFYQFYKRAFTILEPGTDYLDSWFIEYLCETLQAEAERVIRKEEKTGDLIINVSPRSSKSLICSVVFPVWVWTCSPIMRFAMASYSADLSLELAVKSRDLLASDWFRSLYPDLALKDDSNSKGEYKNTKGGSRLSTSVGGTITGKGANFLILDDAQNPKQAASEVEIKNALEWYTGTAYNRINKEEVDVRIIIQQRLHESDLSGHLLANHAEDYRHICLPIALSDNVSPAHLADRYVDGLLWPERFNQKFIDKYRAMMGSTKFAGQYMQRPQAREGGLFKRTWFKVMSRLDFDVRYKDKSITWHLVIDAAETEKANNDPTGSVVYCFLDNTIYIAHAAGVRKEFVGLVAHLKDYIGRYHTSGSKVYIEGKSSGKSLISQLRKDTNFNIVEVQPGRDSKFVRAESVTPWCESMRVVLLEGGWNEEFLEQVVAFPNASHDEWVDCLYYSIQKKGAGSFFFASV